MCTQMRTHGLACHWFQFPQSEILWPMCFGRQKVHPPMPLARQEHSLSRDDVYHLSTRCGQHSLPPVCVIGVRSCVAKIVGRRHTSRRVSTQGHQQVFRTPEEHSCNSVCTAATSQQHLPQVKDVSLARHAHCPHLLVRTDLRLRLRIRF